MFRPPLARLVASAVVTSLATLPSCQVSVEAPGPPVHALFVAPSSLDELADTHFLDHPWPSDLRREPDGTVRMAGLYNPTQSPVVDAYLGATKGLFSGFSPAASAYFRFDGAVDPSSLPSSPPASLSSASALQLVDVDPSSPEYGKRRLVEWSWRPEEGVYWQADTLAVVPARGFPLRPKTRYALFATRALKSISGEVVLPSDDLRAVLGLAPATEASSRVASVFSPALSELDKLGVSRADIVHFTSFTTNDPVGELFSIVDDVHAKAPAPAADPSAWKATDQNAAFDVYEGRFGPVPNFQVGDPSTGFDYDGGSFSFGADGHAVQQGSYTLRFALAVPNVSLCPMPKEGYPIALYAHGTGGNYRSVVAEGRGVGLTLAQQCIASMGIDQIFHGDRAGAPPAGTPPAQAEGIIALRFYNLNNPLAARTNGRQAAIDVVQQARLLTETHLVVPVADAANNAVSRTAAPIALDGTRLIFVGHSQGGVNGPLFLAADRQARGGVLSGTGAMITVALLEKTKPSPGVAGAVRALLGLASSVYDGELDAFHPILNLTQALIDTTDPVHYMPYITTHPRDGAPPKSIYQSEGIGSDGVGDSYAPPTGIEYAALALGLPRQSPGVRAIPGAAWGGIGDVSVGASGLSGNLAGGKATGVLAQFPPAPGSDGHFVIFDVPQARRQYAGFCKSLVTDAVPVLPPL